MQIQLNITQHNREIKDNDFLIHMISLRKPCLDMYLIPCEQYQNQEIDLIRIYLYLRDETSSGQESFF